MGFFESHSIHRQRKKRSKYVLSVFVMFLKAVLRAESVYATHSAIARRYGHQKRLSGYSLQLPGRGWIFVKMAQLQRRS